MKYRLLHLNNPFYDFAYSAQKGVSKYDLLSRLIQNGLSARANFGIGSFPLYSIKELIKINE